MFRMKNNCIFQCFYAFQLCFQCKKKNFFGKIRSGHSQSVKLQATEGIHQQVASFLQDRSSRANHANFHIFKHPPSSTGMSPSPPSPWWPRIMRPRAGTLRSAWAVQGCQTHFLIIIGPLLWKKIEDKMLIKGVLSVYFLCMCVRVYICVPRGL